MFSCSTSVEHFLFPEIAGLFIWRLIHHGMFENIWPKPFVLAKRYFYTIMKLEELVWVRTTLRNLDFELEPWE